MKRGGAPTGRNASGQLAEETDAKQEMDSQVERELKNLLYSDSEAADGKRGQ